MCTNNFLLIFRLGKNDQKYLFSLLAELLSNVVTKLLILFQILIGYHWNFMVSLHKGTIYNRIFVFAKYPMYCTGSIISSKFVITAGGLYLTQILWLTITCHLISYFKIFRCFCIKKLPKYGDDCKVKYFLGQI